MRRPTPITPSGSDDTDRLQRAIDDDGLRAAAICRHCDAIDAILKYGG